MKVYRLVVRVENWPQWRWRWRCDSEWLCCAWGGPSREAGWCSNQGLNGTSNHQSAYEMFIDMLIGAGVAQLVSAPAWHAKGSEFKTENGQDPCRMLVCLINCLLQSFNHVYIHTLEKKHIYIRLKIAAKPHRRIVCYVYVVFKD